MVLLALTGVAFATLHWFNSPFTHSTYGNGLKRGDWNNSYNLRENRVSRDELPDYLKWGVELDVDLDRDYDFGFNFQDRLNRDQDVDSKLDTARQPDTIWQPLDVDNDWLSDTVRMPVDARQRDSTFDPYSKQPASRWVDPDLSIDYESLFEDTLHRNHN